MSPIQSIDYKMESKLKQLIYNVWVDYFIKRKSYEDSHRRAMYCMCDQHTTIKKLPQRMKRMI